MSQKPPTGKAHKFDEPGPVVRGGASLRCINKGCRIVWHEDRNMPRSNCLGGDPEYAYTYSMYILETRNGVDAKDSDWRVRDQFVHHNLGAAVDSLYSGLVYAIDLLTEGREGPERNVIVNPDKDGTRFLLIPPHDPSHAMVVFLTEKKG